MSEKSKTAEPGNEILLKELTREPRKAKVVLLNDDYTTMEFVVEILMTIFHKNETQATEIMLAVHRSGKGICGIYPEEIAETKVGQVYTLARTAGFPLRCVMEYI